MSHIWVFGFPSLESLGPKFISRLVLGLVLILVLSGVISSQKPGFPGSWLKLRKFVKLSGTTRFGPQSEAIRQGVTLHADWPVLGRLDAPMRTVGV